MNRSLQHAPHVTGPDGFTDAAGPVDCRYFLCSFAGS